MPRYEFRIFRKVLGALEIKLQRYLPPDETASSAEIYLISPNTDENNVKIREGALEIKTLIQHWSGLEQWQPVLKADFPLPADLLANEFFPRLVVPAPRLEREQYAFEEFLADLIQAEPDLYLVQVAKLRQKFRVEGCQAELSDITIEGQPWRTVALEGEDPQAVLRAQTTLGLAELENINYVKAIKQILAMAPAS